MLGAIMDKVEDLVHIEGGEENAKKKKNKRNKKKK